ncbi:hypothetical protein ACFE04_023588 [Oxalis oulophora]
MLSRVGKLVPRFNIKSLPDNSYNVDLQRARRMFDEITHPELRDWTMLISAHTQHGYPRTAIALYDRMRSHIKKPDKLLLMSVAKACAAMSDLVKAKEIHDEAIRLGLGSDTLLGNSFIDMYTRCKCIDGAKKVFDNLKDRDVVTWTSMISCCVRQGLAKRGIMLFRDMQLNGVRPNSLTVASVLPACVELKNMKLGREIHGFVVTNGMEENVFVSSALVHTYASCSSIKQAELVFNNMSWRDTVLWNVLLTAYFAGNESEEGLRQFHQMRNEGVKLNVASWNAVIGGCVQNGLNELALDFLNQMQNSGFKPNKITFAAILPTCSNLESLKSGKEIHGYMYRHLYNDDLTAATALVFMYAKSGELELSERVFNMIKSKDTIAWNTMIIGNAMHGNGNQALRLFKKMLQRGITANSITFMGILSGCSHSCLVDEALVIFNSMSREHNVEPDVDHHSTMVDVFSRAGRLEEAYDFIQKMPMEPSASAWGALLAACKVYKNVGLGKIAAGRLFEIEPDNPGNYVLLSNILVSAKLWEEASEIRKLMRNKGIAKKPGCSWVESTEIYKFLEDMDMKMRLAGYVPNTDYVLQDVEPDEKIESLCSHSEKLAVAFALLNLNGQQSSIRIPQGFITLKMGTVPVVISAASLSNVARKKQEIFSQVQNVAANAYRLDWRSTVPENLIN